MSIAAVLFGLWWLASVALLLGSAVLAMQCRFSPERGRPGQGIGLPAERDGDVAAAADMPISILVPLRSFQETGHPANAALVVLDHPAGEILFSARCDPVGDGAASWREPGGVGLRARCVPTAPRPGWNPKLANLAEPLEAAANDLILVKDAATLLSQETLRAMAAALRPGIGLVCAVPVARRPRGLAAHVEAALINTYGARMLLALSALGGGAGIGAAMLFRRSDLQAAGGLAAIASAVADDHALAGLLAGRGLRTVFAATVDQDLGVREPSAIWRRHLRWAICRRLEEPVAFAAEPLTGLAAACVAASGAAPALGMSFAWAILATMPLWPAVEILLAACRGWPLAWATPLVILLREAVMPALWLRALAARRIVWGGRAMPLSAGRRP